MHCNMKQLALFHQNYGRPCSSPDLNPVDWVYMEECVQRSQIYLGSDEAVTDGHQG